MLTTPAITSEVTSSGSRTAPTAERTSTISPSESPLFSASRGWRSAVHRGLPVTSRAEALEDETRLAAFDRLLSHTRLTP